MAKVINQLLIYDHNWTTHLNGISILIGWVSRNVATRRDAKSQNHN